MIICFFLLFSLDIANQEQRSLVQRCELWKKSSQEKELVCELAEKDKAVLSKKIQVRLISFLKVKEYSLYS